MLDVLREETAPIAQPAPIRAAALGVSPSGRGGEGTGWYAVRVSAINAFGGLRSPLLN